MKTRHNGEAGAISGSAIAITALAILFLGTGAAAIWAYLNYQEASTNLNAKVDLATATAKKDQSEVDEEKFAQREKEPNRQFIGPEDYGRLTFSYPKTWSVYEAKDVAKEGGIFEAYLNPVKVSPIGKDKQFALRITIEQNDFADVLKDYQNDIEDGKLKSSAFSANGHEGTRLDGAFSEKIRGSAVLFKIRDKTLTVRTDADTFKPDFDALIKTINFNS